jgi:hypothetical protein
MTLVRGPSSHKADAASSEASPEKLSAGRAISSVLPISPPSPLCLIQRPRERSAYVSTSARPPAQTTAPDSASSSPPQSSQARPPTLSFPDSVLATADTALAATASVAEAATAQEQVTASRTISLKRANAVRKPSMPQQDALEVQTDFRWLTCMCSLWALLAICSCWSISQMHLSGRDLAPFCPNGHAMVKMQRKTAEYVPACQHVAPLACVRIPPCMLVCAATIVMSARYGA